MTGFDKGSDSFIDLIVPTREVKGVHKYTHRDGLYFPVFLNLVARRDLSTLGSDYYFVWCDSLL